MGSSPGRVELVVHSPSVEELNKSTVSNAPNDCYYDHNMKHTSIRRKKKKKMPIWLRMLYNHWFSLQYKVPLCQTIVNPFQ